MNYTPKQDKLLAALKAMDEAAQIKWIDVVSATNELCEAIENKEESYDASFPPEIEREIAAPALYTVWLYSRLESTSTSRGRNTGTRIRKALGYNG